MTTEKARQPQTERHPAARTKAEWITLAVSLVIVLSVTGYIVYDLITGSTVDPTIEVIPHYEQVRAELGAFYLPITVVNQGGRTAEDVSIHFLLKQTEGRSQSTSLTFRFLAPGERSEAVLIFDEHPEEGRLLYTSNYVRP
ncbi:MAG: hypothetical protein R3272_11595 [Candidatus Promineifilaceae bacterium]|nr:hypothetical protein [Candidatus Promineifilaceae bacterium]